MTEQIMLVEKKNRFSVLCSWMVALSPLLDAYYLPGTKTLMSVAVLFLFSLFILVSSKRKVFNLPQGYIWFVAYAFLIPIANQMRNYPESALTSSVVSIGYYTFCLAMMLPLIKWQDMIKAYRLVVIAAIVVFLLQEISYVTTGLRFSALLPFLTVRYDDVGMADFMAEQANANRSSSLFLEPSHFVQYVTPFLAILLGEAYKRKKLFYLPAVLLSVLVFYTKSGTGILMLAVCWSFFLIKYPITLMKKIILLFPLSVITAFLLFDIIASTEIGQNLLNRQQELVIGGTSWVSSGNVRIQRGYLVFFDENFRDQLLGVGNGAIPAVIDRSRYLWMFGQERYTNLVQSLLMGTGYIGTALFGVHLVNLYNKNTYAGKGIIIVLVSLSFIESFLYGSKMLLLIILAFSFQGKYNELHDIKMK